MPASPLQLSKLAFVDIETSGLNPASDRITEIGVVTIGESGVREWTTFVNPGRQYGAQARLIKGIADEEIADAPRFGDIARELAQRLDGHLFVAHNARFDFAFLRSEFERAGIFFQPQVLCTVMLSRKLYPESAAHDLDSLMRRHSLPPAVRHRALPDARLVHQFWQVLERDQSPAKLQQTVDALLAGPVLPDHLESSLVDRLPDAPGVFMLHGDGDAVLHLAPAANLRLHVQNYFRLDRVSARALEVSHRVTNITWRATHGAMGAQLQLHSLARAMLPRKARAAARGLYSWRLTPDAYPCLELVSLADDVGCAAGTDECYGMYDSERKAGNALVRLAGERRLCHALLGIREAPGLQCAACDFDVMCRCGPKMERLRHFTNAVSALRPLRVAKWPYDGAIGVRERSDVHVIHNWHYLGTAQNEQDVHRILQNRPEAFDQDTFEYLLRALPRVPAKRIVPLASFALMQKRAEYLVADAMS